ncbi:ankyrin repeat and zinc finger domain-containing protein 1-like [Impatiens glandulifera]|uniref:ankyrin repeat and zinc finger domain-containing protein 1-like n=1 Tax=Impatiens glandulifera TaxID=253017 RepID=UPI001FB15665|nr:ankyrin repeat and zinc finger domain-containing protein 1-like [Impatiens glandulifera]
MNDSATINAAAGGDKTNDQDLGPKQKRQAGPEERRNRSVFDVPQDFFDLCRLVRSPTSVPDPSAAIDLSEIDTLDDEILDSEQKIDTNKSLTNRWSCNTCKAEFDSLQEQRSHFKSDLHRFNVKLSLSGKDTLKEEEFDDLISDSLLDDYDVSSISGSEDEHDKESSVRTTNRGGGFYNEYKRKLFIHVKTGEQVSIWKGLVMDEDADFSLANEKSVAMDKFGSDSCLSEKELIERLKFLVREPKDIKCLRIVLLVSGGHFAGCVFDRNLVVTHKTFHRYVIRGKAGKKQSTKDAGGRAAHSAGASLRRYNELALKKEIQELLTSWNPYFLAARCIFISAPSSNRQLLFNADQPYFTCDKRIIRNIPLTVKRPTFKEAKRVYTLLTQINQEIIVEETVAIIKKPDPSSRVNNKNDSHSKSGKEKVGDDLIKSSNISEDDESAAVSNFTTELHEAAKCGNGEKVLELLEQGSDPCVKDGRGWTPYTVASEKEVRNIFRRFMASNLEKWDWHAAKVPSALTKEMEDSQASKQAEKDAKKKARAKELKKLRKAKESKAQAEAIQSKKNNENKEPIPRLSKEEELERKRVADREKRAEAAERRMAALNSDGQQKGVVLDNDMKCSCCDSSLVGKVPFHRYNYKYCTTSCMHAHKEILEDEP